ncbi:MAG TPA: bifunctional homocysteine S-methyltransferase/methylenetetrahydrofolate reductase [Candidatus Limnocylindria bacterium]|nr:bifunctional homocysteine S-methyltransferase/methylenetetrahydrofolate reductase [Candidatus Limnocylindria bacterium]
MSGTASSQRDAFAARLAKAPLLLDGAMGTLLYSRGVPQRASLDELVEARPDLIGAIHREYIEAGADAIETHSFGANRLRLAPFGLADKAAMFNRRAAQIAREARDVAGKRDVLVAGSIGPLEAPLHGPDARVEQRIRDAFREQIEGLLEGGVDFLLFETFSDLRELLIGISEAKALSDLPIVAQMTFGEELLAVDGTSPQTAATALAQAGVDAVGVNCGVGPQICLDALTQMGRPSAGLARSILPNAGLPQRVEGQFVYAAGPSYFAGEVPRFLDAGARIVGGCCGTTPEHIRHMRQALDLYGAKGLSTKAAAVETPEIGGTPRTPVAERPGGSMAEPPPPTRLARLLTQDTFVVSVEIDPPRSVRIERTIEAARLLQEAGVDVVNISDSAMARVRMGALAVAFGVQHDLDLECVVHFTTRDRNLMALESELLGAHALGVRNILALTGDPPRVGDYPSGTGIWDVDSVGLIGILARLNRGEDQAGKPIGSPAGFTVACALDPTADNLEREIERLAAKIDAGANVVMTQPIYSRDQWDRFTEAAAARWSSGLPVPVLLGVLPLHTARHADFLHNEVPGISIPDEVRAAMHAAGERGAEVGLEMAHRLLESLAPLVHGTYIMPSFGRYELAAELVRRVRADNRIVTSASVTSPGSHHA